MKAKLQNLLRFLRHPITSIKIIACEARAANAVARRKLQHPGCEDAMNVWPPVAGVTTGFEVDADDPTSIRWGTDELLQSPTPSGGYAIVLRMSQKELVDISLLPNGTGVNVNRVRIKQGGNWSITVRDNQNVTWPKIGGSVSVIDMAGHIGTIGLVYSTTVIDNDYEAQLKAPGERTLLVEKMTLIETGSGVAQ